MSQNIFCNGQQLDYTYEALNCLLAEIFVKYNHLGKVENTIQYKYYTTCIIILCVYRRPYNVFDNIIHTPYILFIKLSPP